MPKSLLVAYRNCNDVFFFLHFFYEIFTSTGIYNPFFVNLATFTKALDQLGSYLLFVCLFVCLLLCLNYTTRKQNTFKKRNKKQANNTKSGFKMRDMYM